jgi:hypothetical protein
LTSRIWQPGYRFISFTLADSHGSEQLKFHAVISNISRNGNPDEGLQMLKAIRDESPPIVFYILNLDESRGTPPGSFGITNRPDELMHLLLDVLERTRL